MATNELVIDWIYTSSLQNTTVIVSGRKRKINMVAFSINFRRLRERKISNSVQSARVSFIINLSSISYGSEISYKFSRTKLVLPLQGVTLFKMFATSHTRVSCSYTCRKRATIFLHFHIFIFLSSSHMLSFRVQTRQFDFIYAATHGKYLFLFKLPPSIGSIKYVN